jgi:hypothetical protein
MSSFLRVAKKLSATALSSSRPCFPSTARCGGASGLPEGERHELAELNQSSQQCVAGTVPIADDGSAGGWAVPVLHTGREGVPQRAVVCAGHDVEIGGVSPVLGP